MESILDETNVTSDDGKLKFKIFDNTIKDKLLLDRYKVGKIIVNNSYYKIFTI